MKITKTAKQARYEQKLRRRANAGCDVCPECGAKNSTKFPIVVNIGVRTETVVTGFMCKKVYNKDCYHCIKCGAEWESDLYRARG